MTSSSSSLELFLAWLTQDGDRLPHWILMIVPPQSLGHDRNGLGTHYHSKGGPTDGIPYRVAVEPNTNFRERVLNSEFICHIAACNADQVARAADDVPSHQYQKYVVCLLALMEKRQIVPTGHAQALAGCVRMLPRALQHEASHPAPLPVDIELPSTWPMPGRTPTQPLASPHAGLSGQASAPPRRPQNQQAEQRPTERE